MKNPSAITYHFGSKAELVADLVRELYRTQAPVLQLQIDLAEAPAPAAPRRVGRYCGEFIGRSHHDRTGLPPRPRLVGVRRLRQPDVFEEYLASGNATSVRWIDGVGDDS